MTKTTTVGVVERGALLLAMSFVVMASVVVSSKAEAQANPKAISQTNAQKITGIYLSDAPGGRVYTIANSGDGTLQFADLKGEHVVVRPLTAGGLPLDDGRNLEVVDSNRILVIDTAGTQLGLTRVTGTDVHFPLSNQPGPFMPPALLAGAWDIVELSLDLRTGEVLPQFDGSMEFIDVFDLSVEGQGLRFTDSVGIYFQGAMAKGNESVFHIIGNNQAAVAGQPLTLLGSANNFSRDVLGWARFPDVNHFSALLVLETYQGGAQFLLSIEGTRVTPQLAGDVNLDGDVSVADRTALIQQFGLSNRRVGFNLAADLNPDGYLDRRDLEALDVTPLPTKHIGPWLSGLWFNTQRDGEGFHLLIQNEQQAVVAWFTYGPQGGQAWVIGTASIANNVMDFDEVLITSGAVFGDAFDPTQLVRTQWGDIRLLFDSCDAGWVGYNGPSEFANGGYSLSRLTTPAGLDCENESVSAEGDLGRYTGVWYDPAQDGAGWFVDDLGNGQAAVTWFTYSSQAQQQWMIGVGNVTDQGIEIPDLQQTRGARFGSAFDPGAVTREVWGTFQMSSGCDSGSVSYQSSLAGFGQGTQGVQPLARIEGLSCL